MTPCPFCLTAHTELGHCTVPDAPAYAVYVDAELVDADAKYLYFAPCSGVDAAKEVAGRMRSDPTMAEVRVWTRRPSGARVNNNSGRDGFRYIRLDPANGDLPLDGGGGAGG